MALKITGEPRIKIASSTIGMGYHIFLTLAIGVSDSDDRNLSIPIIIYFSGQSFSEEGTQSLRVDGTRAYKSADGVTIADGIAESF